MSLSAILDDVPENTPPDQTVISSEDLSVRIKMTTKPASVVSPINKATVAKFNLLYSKIVNKDLISKMTKVDHKLATEVFTMLPEASIVEQAKMTSAPSAINREVILKALDNVQDVAPEDAVQMLGDLRDTLTAIVPLYHSVCEKLETITKNNAEHVKRLSDAPAIVMVDNEAHNLLTTKISRLSYLDDTSMEYPKYANALSKKFHSLMVDETFAELYRRLYPTNQSAYVADLTLMEVVELISATRLGITGNRANLETYAGQLEVYLGSDTKDVYERGSRLVNDAESAMETAAFVQMIDQILSQPGNFIDQVTELLTFID